jgi:ribonuclease HI
MQRRRLKIYFDGGCQPNPGPMEIAVVARGIAYYLDDVGCGSNCDAEWLALIHALRVAQSLGIDDFVLIGDSALVVNQANGIAKCRSVALQRHRDLFQSLKGGYASVRVRQVGRAQNLAGIALAKRNDRFYSERRLLKTVP